MRNIDENSITQAALATLAGKTPEDTDVRSGFCTWNDYFTLNPGIPAK